MKWPLKIASAVITEPSRYLGFAPQFSGGGFALCGRTDPNLSPIDIHAGPVIAHEQRLHYDPQGMPPRSTVAQIRVKRGLKRRACAKVPWDSVHVVASPGSVLVAHAEPKSTIAKHAQMLLTEMAADTETFEVSSHLDYAVAAEVIGRRGIAINVTPPDAMQTTGIRPGGIGVLSVDAVRG